MIPHYLITRFSIPATYAKENQWKSLTWLAHRIELFTKYTAPSVLYGRELPTAWLLLCDRSTPFGITDALSKVATVVRITDTWQRDVRQYVYEDAMKCGAAQVVTTRLDSDDMIADDFISGINEVVARGDLRAPFMIDHPFGVTYDSDTGEWHGREYLTHMTAFSPFFSRFEAVSSDLQTVYSGDHGKMKLSGVPFVEQSGIKWCQVIHDRNIANTNGEAALPAMPGHYRNLFHMEPR